MNDKIKLKKGDILYGKISKTKSGNAFLICDDLSRDIYINKKNTNRALDLDEVKVEITKTNKLEGKVIKIVERDKKHFTGKLTKNKELHFVELKDKDFFVPNKNLNGARENQNVVVEFIEWNKHSKSPLGKIVKIIGESGDNDSEMHTIMSEHGLPYEFEKDVLDESEKIDFNISDLEIDRRLDMRDVLTFTIDGETAKDLDDAISVRWVNGVLELGVHIADVTHYVKKGSLIDKEAYNRGNSVYLVDRCVPMLPSVLSNNVCSLNEKTDKLVYSFIFKLDKDGGVIDSNFSKGIINSNHRLTYKEVESVLNGGETHSKELKDSLIHINKIAKKIRSVRTKGSLSIETKEVKFILDENSKPIGVTQVKNLESNKLIEEFMVLTNRLVCKFLSNKNKKMIHRAHGSPITDKVSELSEYLKNVGVDFVLDKNDIKSTLNNVLKEVKGTIHENMVNNLIVRSQQKAVYQTDNIGHWGMGLDFYTHVTSPIRRYSDYMIHQMLNKTLPKGGYLK